MNPQPARIVSLLLYATDGQYFFNWPGPRLVESAEILAEICHPGAASWGHPGSAWERVA